jgi:ribosomal protein L19E
VPVLEKKEKHDRERAEVHVKITAIFNTSEQSSAFNHGYGSWASEPKARTPSRTTWIKKIPNKRGNVVRLCVFVIGLLILV